MPDTISHSFCKNSTVRMRKWGKRETWYFVEICSMILARTLRTTTEHFNPSIHTTRYNSSTYSMLYNWLNVFVQRMEIPIIYIVSCLYSMELQYLYWFLISIDLVAGHPSSGGRSSCCRLCGMFFRTMGKNS